MRGGGGGGGGGDDDVSERDAYKGESVASDMSPRMRRPTNSGLDVASAGPTCGVDDDGSAPNAGVEAALTNDAVLVWARDVCGCAWIEALRLSLASLMV